MDEIKTWIVSQLFIVFSLLRITASFGFPCGVLVKLVCTLVGPYIAICVYTSSNSFYSVKIPFVTHILRISLLEQLQGFSGFETRILLWFWTEQRQFQFQWTFFNLYPRRLCFRGVVLRLPSCVRPCVAGTGFKQFKAH